MTDKRALQRLLTWLSPAFPTGAFAYSAGLETAISQGAVSDSDATRNWIAGSLAHGALRNDAILLAAAFRAQDNAGRLAEIAELALALTPALERRAETLTLGDTFRAAAAAWPHAVLQRLPAACPYPVAVGAVAGAHDVGLGDTLVAFLAAGVQGQVSVALRLVPLGQSAGLAVVAGLEPEVERVAGEAQAARLDDLGGAGYAADIAAMTHEGLAVRVFRS